MNLCRTQNILIMNMTAFNLSTDDKAVVCATFSFKSAPTQGTLRMHTDECLITLQN